MFLILTHQHQSLPAPFILQSLWMDNTSILSITLACNNGHLSLGPWIQTTSKSCILNKRICFELQPFLFTCMAGRFVLALVFLCVSYFTTFLLWLDACHLASSSPSRRAASKTLSLPYGFWPYPSLFVTLALLYCIKCNQVSLFSRPIVAYPYPIHHCSLSIIGSMIPTSIFNY